MTIGLGARRKTILLVDPEPHGRALLRKALEAGGFSVGEAASCQEGERVVARINPDAVVADLLAAPAPHGLAISEWLHARPEKVPCYIVSSAGAALIGAVGFHELGVAGVFLKPLDAPLVVQTLRTRLAVEAGDLSRA